MRSTKTGEHGHGGCTRLGAALDEVPFSRRSRWPHITIDAAYGRAPAGIVMTTTSQYILTGSSTFAPRFDRARVTVDAKVNLTYRTSRSSCRYSASSCWAISTPAAPIRHDLVNRINMNVLAPALIFAGEQGLRSRRQSR
jgi:hypothetical protein